MKIHLVFFDPATGVIRQTAIVSNGEVYAVAGLACGIYEPAPDLDLPRVKVDVTALVPFDREYLPDVWRVARFLAHAPAPLQTGIRA